ncbi:MAG: hypothetical protein IKS83_00740 [Victivallales bacterium]|nr:hypothetical protein [Victivallales bacterium]
MAFLPLLLLAVEVLNVKDLDNVQVRDFRTSGVARLRRKGTDAETVPLEWKIYGATAKLQGKEYQIGGFRMDIESSEQGSYSVTASSATFDVDEVEVHGDAPVEISGPGIHVVGLGFDLFTDAEEGVENARSLMLVIREAVEMKMSRAMLRNGGHAELTGEAGAENGDDGHIALTASRLTMQLSPAERRHGGEGGDDGLPEENGVATLEGNVLLKIPPERRSGEDSSRHWDAWELAGDRMVVFFSYSPPSGEKESRHENQVERVEVSGHLRVETDGGRQRLLGDRGIFTTADERLTIDGNVLMMSQFQNGEKKGAPAGRWSFFFTERALVFFAAAEGRRAQRQERRHAEAVRRVELPGKVTMVAQDGSCQLEASCGEFSSEENRVSLMGEVRGELHHPSSPETGDYLLTGPQVDFLMGENPAAGQMVFPQGMLLRRRDGGNRVRAGWAGIEVLDPEARTVQITCTGNVLAELHGEGGQDRELFLTGEKMVMRMQLANASADGLECIEWMDLPERVTVWGRVKGISHRIGGDRGRYERDSHAVSLEENVVMVLEQDTAEAAFRSLREVRVLSRRAVVHLERDAETKRFGITSIDLADDLVARTADFSVYLSADQAHYGYLDEQLELTGRVRAEFTPGNGQRDFRQAITLETTRVLTQANLQRVVFPSPLTIASADQSIWLAGSEGVLDVAARRCALGGDSRIVMASRKAEPHRVAELELTTSRVLVFLEERPKGRPEDQRSTLGIQRIDLPERLKLSTADGRHSITGNRATYSAQTNAVELDGEVEVRFAGEALESLEAVGLGGPKADEPPMETQEMILNCDHLTARLRSEPRPDDTRQEEASQGQRALSMLDALEIPGRLHLRSADGSRKVTGDRCHYSQAENAVVLDGNCRLEYLDERGEHLVETPRVAFDCNTRTIVTGQEPAKGEPDKETAGTPSRTSTRTTITIPFATRPASPSESSARTGSQKKR